MPYGVHGASPGPRPAFGDPDARRITQISAGDRFDPSGDSRREQHRLPFGGDVGENRFDILRESHIEHLVRLVEHHHPQSRKAQRSPPEMIDRPTRRRHHHIHARMESPQLSTDRLTAVDRHDPHAQLPTVSVHASETCIASSESAPRSAPTGPACGPPPPIAARSARRTPPSSPFPWPPGPPRRDPRAAPELLPAGSASAPHNPAQKGPRAVPEAGPSRRK